MVTLTRADGNWAGDLDLFRRSIALALAGGYAVAAFDANAEPIHTDETGLVAATVEIQAADRKIPGYLARPAGSGKHPVVFVNSEIFGVHEWIKDICRRLAKAGYVALAPDLFVRTGDPSKLTDMKRLGVTGFCWGGGATWRCCENFPDFKAGVAWYGPLKAGAYPRTPPIEAVKDLKAPVLGLYGGQDRGIPIKDIKEMRAAVAAAHKNAEIIVYPDSQHGFLADDRPSYDAKASADAWAKMLAFFKKNGVA